MATQPSLAQLMRRYQMNTGVAPTFPMPYEEQSPPEMGADQAPTPGGPPPQTSSLDKPPAQPRLAQRVLGGFEGQPGGGAAGAIGGLAHNMLGAALGPTQAPDIERERLQRGQLQGQSLIEKMRLEEEDKRLQEMLAATGMRTGAQRDIAAGRNQTMENIADTRAQSAQDVATTRAGATTGAANIRAQGNLATEAMRAASNERIAAARNVVMEDASRIRAAAAQNRLGAVEQRTKDFAITTLPQINQLMQETQDIAQQLGPAAGRWNDFMTGKVGAPNPQFAHYIDEMRFLDSAITMAHSQGRISNVIFQQFKDMLQAGQQSPENLMQALDVSREWMQAYTTLGTPQFGQQVPAGFNPTPQPQRPNASPQQQGTPSGRRVINLTQ